MYKKKQFLAMCLAGLCSTTTVANVYNVTAMAATAASATIRLPHPLRGVAGALLRAKFTRVLSVSGAYSPSPH